MIKTPSTQARGLDAGSVRTAVHLATRAPSIHNTQPWRWELRDGTLSLYADRSRQLTVADPDGHSLLLSCGAALALTELALRAAGWQVEITRLPDLADQDLLATLRATDRVAVDDRDVERVSAAQRRRSDRRPFVTAPTGPEIEKLRAAAAAPDVFAHFATDPDEALNLAVVVTEADQFEQRNAEYLAEMTRWIRPESTQHDGVPITSIPHVGSGSPRHTDVPVRDFEVGVSGAQLIPTGVDEHPLLAVVFTTSDHAIDQIWAGEAMMRLMVEAELNSLACCPLSQSIDMLAFRTRLQTLMGWTQYPQMMLRLGRPAGGIAAPLAPRRPLEDVLRIIR
jgi:nitroreductase